MPCTGLTVSGGEVIRDEPQSAESRSEVLERLLGTLHAYWR